MQDEISFVHDTPQDSIYLQVLTDKDGGWNAFVTGERVARGEHFKTLEKANAWVLKRFARMFPGHACNERCRTIEEAAMARSKEIEGSGQAGDGQR